MGGLLDGLPLGQISAGALVTLVVLLILTGKLVTRRQLLDAQSDRDHWRASSEEWQRVATRFGMSVERLLVLAETSNHALVEIQAVLPRPGEEQR